MKIENIVLFAVDITFWIAVLLFWIFSNEKVCRKMYKGYGEFKIKALCQKHRKDVLENLAYAIMITAFTLLFIIGKGI